MPALDINAVEVIVAAAGVVGSWAVLRAAVADLKKDVAALRELVTTTTMLQAQHKALEIEIDRVRLAGHDNRNRMQDLSERLARVEAHIEAEGERS